MGQLRDRRIVQSRIWLDPNTVNLPSYDYDYSYPITVYDAVKKTMDDGATSLTDELDSIYRLIADKQDIINPGTPGHIMTWSGMKGQIGSLEVTRSINSDMSQRSHQKIPTERAVGDLLDTRVSAQAFNSHADDREIHISEVERVRWNSMASLSALQAHIGNGTMHITDAERGRWNNKADQKIVDDHVYNTGNPHGVTAHQIGTYTQREVDDMFQNLRESFFNYVNITWDERINRATLTDYHPADWNPNYVLQYGDTLPDVPDPTLIYFALKPATDYQTAESDDCIIYIKRPGLTWQEVGFESMHAGDMVIKYPDTTMYAWVQGRFMALFGNATTGDIGAADPSDPVNSDMMWRPSLNENGELEWTRSKELEPPDPMYIKGEDGYTPVKGIDYVDGADGQGVAPGGAAGDILIKLTDETYDTTWRSLFDVLGDLVLRGQSLPEGVVTWESIADRPVIYDELGEHPDGAISQRAATNQMQVLQNNINQLQELVSGPDGVDHMSQTLFDHLNDYNNPHRVTAAAIGAVSNSIFMDHTTNYLNPHNVTPAQIGLGNVNNTADLDKPISIATQQAIDEIKVLIGAIDGDIDAIDYVSHVFWNDHNTTITFTFRSGAEVDVVIPFIDVFSNLYFDQDTRCLVFTMPDGSEKKVDISAMIRPYKGFTSDNIQVRIENDNIINANIIPNSISDTELKPSIYLRGSPTTTTQAVSDRSTRIATTEFVANQVIDNLISYETDRPLSANMGRILNSRKADIDDIIEIIHEIEGLAVLDELTSTSPTSALSANMGRVLDLTKAPRVHTSSSGATYGQATIRLFGHAKAADDDPLMDGTVFRGTDNGEYARGDHRHPTDKTRAPVVWPDTEHGITKLIGEPRAESPDPDSHDDRIATTEWSKDNLASLGPDGTVSITQLPPLDYIKLEEKARPDGVATLDHEGKIPSEQLPDISVTVDVETGKIPPEKLPDTYIPMSQKAQPEGVATLGEDGKVPDSQLPLAGGHWAGVDPPENKKLLWIDTGEGNVMKFWDEAHNEWDYVAAVWT